MLDFRPIFCYNLIMEKIDIDPDTELVVTVHNLLNVIEGLSKISKSMEKMVDKMPEKDSKELMLAVIATFVCVVQMFPDKERSGILELMNRDLGIDLRDMPRF